MWLGALVAGVALAAVALEIAIFGFVPGVTDPNQLQLICWSALLIMLAPMLLAIVAGFAHDIKRSTEHALPAISR
jgi:hypothetical protein